MSKQESGPSQGPKYTEADCVRAVNSIVDNGDFTGAMSLPTDGLRRIKSLLVKEMADFPSKTYLARDVEKIEIMMEERFEKAQK